MFRLLLRSAHRPHGEPIVTVVAAPAAIVRVRVEVEVHRIVRGEDVKRTRPVAADVVVAEIAIIAAVASGGQEDAFAAARSDEDTAFNTILGYIHDYAVFYQFL